MTAADMWALVSSGGTTATLLIVLWLVLTERLTTGTQTQRERDRALAADAQADKHQELLQRVLSSAEESLQEINRVLPLAETSLQQIKDARAEFRELMQLIRADMAELSRDHRDNGR
ncbi:MAG TPA: hypothetical protein PK478_02055 [Nitrospira sp.]|nr:hypothetical protein [Nitrospira sp.]